MSFLDHIQIIIDFGLVVLIWMVQLIIYPSFLYYDRFSLSKWHRTYTGRITVIVAPLMTAQVILASYIMINKGIFGFAEVLALALISISWLLTIFVFIPIHGKIDKSPENQEVQKKLVRLNWIRVFLFCATFFIHFQIMCLFF